jgi:hypothetical protein
MLKKILTMELYSLAFAVLTLRNLVIAPGIGDAIIMTALSGLYAYKAFLASKQEAPVNEQIKEEIKEIKSSIGALSLKPTISRPVNPNVKYF